MKSLTISTPGKLFIAGEYAVVKGYQAILCATHVTLDVTIKEAYDFFIHSTKWQQGHTFDLMSLPSYQVNWSKALHTAYTYLKALQIEVRTHHIHIESQLDQSMYAKWGLGSSGAFIVGLIESVLAFHDVLYDALLLYKLAVISQYEQHALASFADIATAAFKCAIVYKKFKDIPMDTSILIQVQSTWEDLMIAPIVIEDLPIMVINTGKEASSLSLVKHFLEHSDISIYTKLFHNIETLTSKLIESIESKQPFHDIFSEMMLQYEQLPNIVYDKIVNDPILNLMKLEGIQSNAKFSGAGGGDNIIVYVHDQTHYQEILKQLKKEHTDISHLIKGVKRYE